MSIFCGRPFKNKYTISQLESFGINVSKFSKKDRANYLLYGKGKLAKIVQDIEKTILNDEDIEKLACDVAYAIYDLLEKFKAEGRFKNCMISNMGLSQANCGVSLHLEIDLDNDKLKSKIKENKKYESYCKEY